MFHVNNVGMNSDLYDLCREYNSTRKFPSVSLNV